MSTPFLLSYVPKETAQVLCKLADEDTPAKRVARTAIKGIAGTALGTVAGGAAGRLGQMAFEKIYKKPLPYSPVGQVVAPVLGAAAAVAYSLYRAHESKELRDALESPGHKPSGNHAGG